MLARTALHHASRRDADVLVLMVELVTNVEVLADADMGEVVLEIEDRVEEDVVRPAMLLFRDCRLSCLSMTSGCPTDCLA